MGNSESKPTPGPSHVWKSETPVRFSEQLVESLQSSAESDSTRAKTLELHIQNRVADELRRLEAREEQTLKDISEKLSADEPASSADKKAGDQLRGFGRESVQRDVAALRQKLESRKKVVEIGELNQGMEKARNDVISCLRTNDGRPLDCWREVEAFKAQVSKVEAEWVEKVVR